VNRYLSRPASSYDSPLEENGFEISVPRQIDSGFEASVGLGPIDNRRGEITLAVVGLGKPIELFLWLKEPPLTRRNEGAPRCWRWRGIAELNVRSHSAPAESPCLAGFRPPTSKRRAFPAGLRGGARQRGRERRAWQADKVPAGGSVSVRPNSSTAAWWLDHADRAKAKASMLR